MTGPHKPLPGGGYHELPGRHRTRPPADPPPPESAPPPPSMADLARQVGELQKAIGNLGAALASSESDVAKTPAPAPAAAPKTERSSDPALTRAERKVKIFGAGIGVLVALSAALASGLGLAWSYIKGYGDDRAARAVEIEEAQSARDQLDDHEARLTKFVLEQKSLVETIASVQGELTDLRRYRELHRLEAEYLNAINEAIAHRRKPPPKSFELVAAEIAAGIHSRTP